jgi:hypothetical protein
VFGGGGGGWESGEEEVRGGDGCFTGVRMM